MPPSPVADPYAATRAFARHPTVRAFYAVNKLFARAYHHLELRTPCPIPDEGPAILICNHAAGLDPMLLQSTCKRIITWMMAKEFYELPGVRQFCGRMRYIPVARGTRDSASLKAAFRALDAGALLGIFPEGRIEPTRELLPFTPGVAVIAARSRAPVYPAYIAGIERNMSIFRGLLDPQWATLAYGPKIEADANAELTADVMQAAVERLRRQTLAAMTPRDASSKGPTSKFSENGGFAHNSPRVFDGAKTM